ncbi:hypothetical protein, partial [uncultured Candidatus Kuenenia sp.]|uniref:hypothetical protein n=1 Tax=uncultured Candidatus Kuenenia sp. TaxID=1048336 RepID=UPI0025F889D4
FIEMVNLLSGVFCYQYTAEYLGNPTISILFLQQGFALFAGFRCHYKGTSVSLRGSFPKQSVYYEIFRDVRNAISRDKQIKGGSKGLKNRIN